MITMFGRFDDSELQLVKMVMISSSGKVIEVRCRGLIMTAQPSYPVKYKYAMTIANNTAPDATTSLVFQLLRDLRRCSSVSVP